ncbi:MAG TPA: homoserine kinase [Terracidiphilus sp.]|jgi:homoserine kinase|nr:homoserine kinase [Terracidiphilus sp.]
MSGSAQDWLRLRLPATSANLGPGFDTAAVALDFFLDVEAAAASEFSITAAGRDTERCAQMEDNLVLDLYRTILSANGRPVVPLAINMRNAIPLGMGCGSSAAGRLAAIAMAVHFGQLGWTSDRILAEAAALEGHPDNAAACWLGGFVAAAADGDTVQVARVVPPAQWRAIVVLPTEPLATSHARAVLPDGYSRADVVANLQAVSLLGLAFAQGRGDLLRTAMADRIHQPYRAAICAQLPRLLPLAGSAGILGVALSGAGPAVLVIVDGEQGIDSARAEILMALSGLHHPELLVCRFEPKGADSLSSLQSA